MDGALATGTRWTAGAFPTARPSRGVTGVKAPVAAHSDVAVPTVVARGPADKSADSSGNIAFPGGYGFHIVSTYQPEPLGQT
jgi:hypothetical protein